MLDDTENYIKDNLQNILDGKFDDKFDKEQCVSELPIQFAKETITSAIKNDVVFKSALKQFLRDKKINDILE